MKKLPLANDYSFPRKRWQSSAARTSSGDLGDPVWVHMGATLACALREPILALSDLFIADLC